MSPPRPASNASVLWTGLVAIVLLMIASACRPSHPNSVVVGSKNFTEQLILSELIAEEIEADLHIQVERRFYLAGTYIAQQAMLAGRIDIYAEYTGTALTAILKQEPRSSREEVYRIVKDEYAKQFDFEVGQPLGFNDTFAIEIRGDDARQLHLHTISEAARYTPGWRAGFGYEFMERPDGFKGLQATYALRFAAPPRIMDLGLLTRALKDRQVDLIAGNNTDGLIPALDLFVLEDDRHYFPPYEAVPILRREALHRFPGLGATIDKLAGKISDQEMRELNFAVDGQHRDPKQVVRGFRQRKGL
jgi:osmoprotectant transport system substrate-binding protein